SNGGGITNFAVNAKAGSATIRNEGSTLPNAIGTAGGTALFFDHASADHASITNAAGPASPGVTRFTDNADAGDAAITNQGANLSGGAGGITEFRGTANGGSAVIHNQGAAFPGSASAPGQTLFAGSSSAASATLYADSAPGTAP